ncbi:MAG: type II secretion system F family protein [Cyanobacteria bacterium]|nr:type II secretion system F family protein [Cyanobacteriota bacterium]
MEIALLLLCMIGTVLMGVLGIKSTQQEASTVQLRISAMTQTNYPGYDPSKQLLRDQALKQSFNERVLFPFAQSIFDKTQQFIPLTSQSWVKKKLIQAGYHKPHYPKIFLGIQLICTLTIFGTLFAITSLFGQFGGMISILVSGFFGMSGYIMPMLWLFQQAQKRQESIQKSLPDFLDLLIICVEAGLGLDTAIHKIVQINNERTSSFLRDELIRYNNDLALGKPRRDAMVDMAIRTGVEDLQMIMNALVQAFEMGSSVAFTLRVQADTLRNKRLQKAEEKANKVAVKMVLPIYIFLFPAIFVTIFGPIGLIMINTIMEIFSKVSL